VDLPLRPPLAAGERLVEGAGVMFWVLIVTMPIVLPLAYFGARVIYELYADR
jgi:hypothetical protein